jgi:prepilin-type N-terminal cleavage/methylation domain-containing protein
MKERKGFTLVELAIVLVVIGLILGAIMTGQQLIQNAKYKRLVNDLQGLSAAVYTYYDRYKAYPGDDLKAVDRWGSTYSNIQNGDGDGLIEGSPASTTNISLTFSCLPCHQATGGHHRHEKGSPCLGCLQPIAPPQILCPKSDPQKKKPQTGFLPVYPTDNPKPKETISSFLHLRST